MLSLFIIFFQIFCVTTDNASSNSTFATKLAENTSGQPVPFDIDNWIRCFAHIINLAVQAALNAIKLLLEKVYYLTFIIVQKQLFNIQIFFSFVLSSRTSRLPLSVFKSTALRY